MQDVAVAEQQPPASEYMDPGPPPSGASKSGGGASGIQALTSPPGLLRLFEWVNIWLFEELVYMEN